MKKQHVKKLFLNKTTISNLEEKKLNVIRGGFQNTYSEVVELSCIISWCVCTKTCNCGR